MTWTIRFRPEVEHDLIEAADWYDSKAPGLGGEFIEEFWNAIDVIQERPLTIAVAANGMRPFRMKRFSYLIHYRTFGDSVLVVGVTAGCRDETWHRDRQ